MVVWFSHILVLVHQQMNQATQKLLSNKFSNCVVIVCKITHLLYYKKATTPS
jgi:hypothetical protein